MKNDELEYLKELYFDSIESIDNSRTLIEEKRGNIPLIYHEIEIERITLGIVEYLLNNNIYESKKNFYKSTLAREWTYEAYNNGIYTISKNYVTTYVYESLFYAILSGDKERAVQMANIFGGREEDEKEDFLANKLLGYGLKYVILDDKKNAYDYINKIEENKNETGMKQFNGGHKRVYKGIIDRDKNEFNDGLLFMLKNHKARMKRNGNTLEQYFAYDSIALAMIANERGINIEIEHELLPLKYLETANIEYNKLGLLD